MPAVATPVIARRAIASPAAGYPGLVKLAANVPLPALKPASADSGDDAGVADGVVSLAVSGNRIWGVQVGAYSNYAPAHQAAIRAQLSLSPEIRKSQIAVDETQGRSANKKYFRARLVGLALSEAVAACRQLRAKQISCLVVQWPIAVAMSSGQ